MTRERASWPPRREFLGAALVLPTAVALAGGRAVAQPRTLAPTPSCVDKGAPTPPQTAGPFFKPSSPRRASLIEPGMAGTRIVVAGSVLATDCRPIPGALVDFWHADNRGEYDNAGFRLRGHQFADELGRYRLETIVPGLYPGRTRHFHVRVQAPRAAHPHDPALLPGRARKPRRRDLPARARRGRAGCREREDRRVRLRPGGPGALAHGLSRRTERWATSRRSTGRSR